MERTDETLCQAYLKQGDQDALRCLLERHREGLTLFLFGFVRNAEDAEELMLDAFAEAAAGPTVFSGKSSFKTWLFSIGKHLAMKRLRRERWEIPWEELPPQEDEVLPETRLLQKERKRAVSGPGADRAGVPGGPVQAGKRHPRLHPHREGPQGRDRAKPGLGAGGRRRRGRFRPRQHRSGRADPGRPGAEGERHNEGRRAHHGGAQPGRR